MTIVGGLDIHRAQVTFDYIDTDTGEVRRGRIGGACREQLREWLAQFAGRDAAFALEGCTGWRYVVEELQRAGYGAHVAEPADTQAARGPKKRAKTDRTDAGLLRELLVGGRVPESWIPPAHVLEVRTKVRLYKALRDQRAEWQQRLHAQLFHQGVPAPAAPLTVPAVRQFVLAEAQLSPAGRQQVQVCYRMIDAANAELVALRNELARFARRQPGCRALMERHYGIGAVTAVAIWAELGDPRRFSSSRQAVRHSGLDVTVDASDDKRRRGRLARQGPAGLRWAHFASAHGAARASSPDHHYYAQVKDRLGGNRAALSVARQLARRCHHTLRALGDEAYAEAG
jgi:transposase